MKKLWGQYRDIPVEKPYWVLASRHLLDKSRSVNYERHNTYVANLEQKTGIPYTVPKVLEATTCILMHYVSTGKRLFVNPYSPFLPMTRCQEFYCQEEEQTLVVGCFNENGLVLDKGFNAFRYNGYNKVGTAVVRKLQYSTHSEWQLKTREMLATKNASPANILQILSQHPFLQECYSKYVVQEGFSVGQHTQRVLELAQKYRICLQKAVGEIVSWDEFLLFLALHDIGKGIAQENESLAFGTKLSFKEGELETTQQILTKIMEMLEVPTHKIRLFCEMLRYDTQGLYLLGDIQLEEAFDNILEMAKNCQQDPRVFYRIFKTYHLVDAASYPSLNQYFEFSSTTIKYCSFYIEVDETLAKALEQAEEGRVFFEECLQRVHRNKGPSILHHDFLVHLPQLLKFLEKMHKEMLAYPQQQETYRHIKRGFRDILLYFAKSAQDLDSLQALYVSSLTCVLGRRKPHQPVDYKLDLFFDDTSEIKGLIDLRDKLIHFRKDYLCRYSLSKVENFVRKEMVTKGVKDHVDLDSTALSLLTITYLHGTHAAILPILQRTGMHLMPFERLKQEHITPLREGSAATGNNQYRMSGTSLDHAMDPYNYAAQEDFPSIQSKEEQEIIQFLHFIQECLLDGKKALFTGKDPTEEWTRLAKAILRLRALDPDLYQTYQSKLSEAVQKIELEWGSHPQANMPKMEQCVRYLKEAVDGSLVIPQGIKNTLRHPYGMVLASTTLHAVTSDVQDPSDRCAQKASLLGKDIQIIFTAKKDEDRVKRFLEENGLNGRVTLIDLDRLLNAVILNQLASPYFADIVSKKKLASLTPGTPRLLRPDQPEVTSREGTHSRLSTYFYSVASLAIAAVAVVIFKGRIPEQ
jgi:hypothetical protein